jgi:hypothetical protein
MHSSLYFLWEEDILNLLVSELQPEEWIVYFRMIMRLAFCRQVNKTGTSYAKPKNHQESSSSPCAYYPIDCNFFH